MNTQQQNEQSELKVFFPREQPGEKNGREKSLSSEFKLSRIPIASPTIKHHQQRRLTQVKIV